MPTDPKSHDVTDESTYLSRRNLMRAGILAATTVATATAYRVLNPTGRRSAGAPPSPASPPPLASVTTLPSTSQPTIGDGDAMMRAAYQTSEPRTPFEDITNYNNFYEFSTDKEGVAPAAARFVTRPWTIAVGGLCAKPTTFHLEDVLTIAPIEERIYRMRCVEAWSMVIPWNGFPLSKLLERVEPHSGAKYVAFQTLLDPQRMPNQRRGVLDWPYVEGLRMDEAMHPLTLLASGIYGRDLPPQNGAPLRLVVPWKYGFKGVKSIVKIDLVANEPPTTWNLAAPHEYGFYANVNPHVDHPRWSQATERRIGDYRRRETLLFNGYADQVGHLYAGMDLAKQF